MLDEKIEDMLFQAQNMFLLNDGMPSIIFMKLDGCDDMVLDAVETNTYEEKIQSVQRIKNMIESGKLKEYIYLCEGTHQNDQLCLVVTHASPTQETQYICSVYEHEGKKEKEKYTFGTWLIYDGTKMKGKNTSMINLFGRINCKNN